MNRQLKPAVPRQCAHACLLIAALASAPLSGQITTAGDSAQRAEIDAATSEVLNQKRQRALEKDRVAGRSASARGIVGSVSVAARCVDSFIVNGTHRASASDVKIVAAAQRDCEGGRCRAYQVTAARDSAQPFDLEVSVTCS